MAIWFLLWPASTQWVPRNQSWILTPRQEASPRFGSEDQFVDLCVGSLNQEKWLDNDMENIVLG